MIQADPAQFYPECAQLQVLGEGTAFPNEEDLVAFPGAYNSSGKFDCLFKVREKMLT
jgi:cellulase